MGSIDRIGSFLGDQGLKDPCTCAANTNIALSGLLTVDGVVTVEGDRVLVFGQTDATQNGIYDVSSGTWTRSVDSNGNTSFVGGTLVYVLLGTVNGGLLFAQTCDDSPVVIGTSLIAFVEQSTVAQGSQTATSATSLALTTGAKTLAVQSGKNFNAKQWVLIYETSNPDNCLLAEITSYAGTNLVTNVIATGGTGGPYTDWTVVLTNSPAGVGRQPPVGFGNVTGPGSSVASHVAIFADGTGKIISDGGVLGPLAALSSLTPQYLANAAVAYGVTMLNGTIVESHSAGAVTFALKTLAGTDPSATDPVIFLFRDSNAALGDYVVRLATAATSLVISSGSTLNAANGVAFSLWLTAFDDAGTVRLGVINCLSSVNSIYPLGALQLASTTADDGAGGSDLAQVFYTPNAHALTAKAYCILAKMSWESGLTAAGTWDASPSVFRLYRAGMPLPGDVVQTQATFSAAVASGAPTTPLDDTIPQNNDTEGLVFLSQAIVPASAANLLEIKTSIMLSCNSGGHNCIFLCQDAIANSLTVKSVGTATGGAGQFDSPPDIFYRMRAGQTTSTTLKVRYGNTSGNIVTINGAAAARLFGGVSNSYLQIKEIMT